MKRLPGSSINKLSHAAMTSDINVTPLVDVCLVLLIIFMVVTPMLQKGVPVNLPVTEDPEKTPDTEKQLQISVKADGSVYIGPNVVRKDQVETTLKDIHERTPDREVAVKGDRLVKYGEVLDVLKACREVGFNDVGLVTQPKKTPGEA
jgi:biopolymer transport protein TolR